MAVSPNYTTGGLLSFDEGFNPTPAPSGVDFGAGLSLFNLTAGLSPEVPLAAEPEASGSSVRIPINFCTSGLSRFP